MNISHLRCGPVAVRFTRPPRLSPPQADDAGQVEPAMTGIVTLFKTLAKYGISIPPKNAIYLFTYGHPLSWALPAIFGRQT
jgi:hypothetical protein